MAEDRAESNYYANRRCPLWVISGHCPASASCLLYPRKQTFVSASGMSEKCH
jgi:hypothetical protein